MMERAKVKENLEVAVVQSDIFWLETERNLEQLTTQLEPLTSVDLILLPEMFATGFAVQDAKVAEDALKIVEWMQKIAREKDCAVAGSVALREEDSLFNRLLFVKPDGSMEEYDKRHLFPLSKEPELFTKGMALPFFTYLGWRFCPQICYDLRFPMWSRNGYDEKDGYVYDCLLYAANWPAARSLAWNSLLTARAIENQSYLLAANRVGCDANGTAHCGDSQVLAADGKPLAYAQSDAPQLLTATLSYQALADYRKKFPVFLDRD